MSVYIRSVHESVHDNLQVPVASALQRLWKLLTRNHVMNNTLSPLALESANLQNIKQIHYVSTDEKYTYIIGATGSYSKTPCSKRTNPQ